jgi:hypothetical protein
MGKMKEFLNVKMGVHTVTTGFWNVNLILQFDRHLTEIWKPELKFFLNCSLKLALFLSTMSGSIYYYCILQYESVKFYILAIKSRLVHFYFECHFLKKFTTLKKEVIKLLMFCNFLGIHFIADKKIYVTIFMWLSYSNLYLKWCLLNNEKCG